MKFHIPDDFNIYFSDSIKQRGSILFTQNKVKCVKVHNEYKVEAYVEGSQMYHVEIENKDGRLHMTCNCPCKMHCKHEYALLLHLLTYQLENIHSHTNKANTAYKTFINAMNKPTNKTIKKLSTGGKWKIFFKVLETIVTVILYFFVFLVAIIFTIGMDDYIPAGSRRGKKYIARRTYYKGGKKHYRYYY